MSWLKTILGTSGTPIIDKAVEIADKFIETPEERRVFVERAYQAEIDDRNRARELGHGKKTPSILSYLTLVIALALGAALFSDLVSWQTLTEVQKGLITTFCGFFLRTLGDVYAYWFGSSMGSTDKNFLLKKK